MQTASPLTQIAGPRTIFDGDGVEITLLPGGGHIATRRIEYASGVIELVVESFDGLGRPSGRQSAFIEGGRLPAVA